MDRRGFLRGLAFVPVACALPALIAEELLPTSKIFGPPVGGWPCRAVNYKLEPRSGSLIYISPNGQILVFPRVRPKKAIIIERANCPSLKRA